MTTNTIARPSRYKFFTREAQEIALAHQTWGYPVSRESGLTLPIVLATVILSGIAYAGNWIRPEELPIKQAELEFVAIEGIEGEPPPLGEPEAPEETPVDEVVPPETVPPEPEPQPDPVAELPPPPAPPEFSEPAPDVPPVVQPKPERPKAATPATKPKSVVASVPRGVPSGIAGGRGGSKGDFLAMPRPRYDRVAQQRRYQGSGQFIITYVNGVVTHVTASRSTGESYLDSRTIAQLRKWRVKPGLSGRASVPIDWLLP